MLVVTETAGNNDRSQVMLQTPPSSQRSPCDHSSELDVDQSPAVQLDAEPPRANPSEALAPTAESQSGSVDAEGSLHSDNEEEDETYNDDDEDMTMADDNGSSHE